jgi:hypothetical protein
MLPVTIAPPQSGAGLTLFPLVATEPGDAGYDLLPDALEAGTLVITEVGEDGSVPELVAINRGGRDVLVLDGMQLIGAKQNRTVGRTILLGAGTETPIPVSCMEQGRWRYAARAMKSGLYHSSAKVRKWARAVESAEAASPDAASNPCSPSELLSRAQGQVWAAIRDSGDKHRAYSATGALNDIYDAAGPRMEAITAAFPALDGQVGFVALLAGAPVGADVLDSPGTYARLHDRLVRAYIFEALEAQVESNGATPDLARSFLEGVTTGDRRPLPTVGRGTYRSLAGAVVGGELELDGKVVHLSAFPT